MPENTDLVHPARKDKNKAIQRGDKWNRLYKALEANSLYPF
jgi:hypothetical protein